MHNPSIRTYTPAQRRILEVVRGTWPAYLAGLAGALGWWCMGVNYWFYDPPASGRVQYGAELAAVLGVLMPGLIAFLFTGWALCSYRPLGKLKTALTWFGASYALYLVVWLANID